MKTPVDFWNSLGKVKKQHLDGLSPTYLKPPPPPPPPPIKSKHEKWTQPETPPPIVD